MNRAVHRRLNALLLLDDGWTAERVAQALFIEAETVREHRRRYAAEGWAGLERLAYAGHAPVLTTAQRAELAAELSARLYLMAKAVCGWVAERFGMSYTPHAMAKLLGRIGFVWKRPRRVPTKADAAAQRAFLAQTLAPLMAAAEADPGQPLYFVEALSGIRGDGAGGPGWDLMGSGPGAVRRRRRCHGHLGPGQPLILA